ncbi:hypothetical protein WJX74_009974 [Apatococcus lobatus]|uniref:Uncharacterized protein n=1 Tax=Apatococcus lobatus TaxID=904363 RepID=A0AAW1QUE3_9CHLO
MDPSSEPVISMQQKPMDQAATPVRKQARRKDKAVRMALKQQEDAGMQASGSAAMQLPAVPGAQAVAVPLTVGPNIDVSLPYRWPRITDYNQLPDLLSEWEDGILYATGEKKTVPFKTLERGMAEGKQAVPWRNTDRKPFHEKKLFIYTILHAEQPKDFVALLQSQAEQQKGKGPKQRGKPPSLYACAKRILERDHSSLILQKAAPFEQDILHWELSDICKAHAGL